MKTIEEKHEMKVQEFLDRLKYKGKIIEEGYEDIWVEGQLEIDENHKAYIRHILYSNTNESEEVHIGPEVYRFEVDPLTVCQKRMGDLKSDSGNLNFTHLFENDIVEVDNIRYVVHLAGVDWYLEQIDFINEMEKYSFDELGFEGYIEKQEELRKQFPYMQMPFNLQFKAIETEEKFIRFYNNRYKKDPKNIIIDSVFENMYNTDRVQKERLAAAETASEGDKNDN